MLYSIKKLKNFIRLQFNGKNNHRSKLLNKYRKNNVLISKSASLRAIEGIEIGEDTQILDHAILAAGTLMHTEEESAKPNGKIKIGKKCVIFQGAIIASYGGKIEIGDSVTINPYTVLYGHGNLFIGNNTRIATHTVIIPASHIFSDPNQLIREQGIETQGINIGHDVWIGAGVTILDGITIGDKAVIGAGCVVTKNVPEGEIVVGVPGKTIGSRLSGINTKTT